MTAAAAWSAAGLVILWTVLEFVSDGPRRPLAGLHVRRHHQAVTTMKLIDQFGGGDAWYQEICECGASRDPHGGPWSSLLCRPY